MRSALTAVLLLTLAACSRHETAETPAAPAEVPAAAPAAPTVNGIPIWALPLTAEGWGDVKMGISEDQAITALGGKVKPDAAVKDETWRACHMIRPEAPDGLWIMVEDGKVSRVTVQPPAQAIGTDAGLHVGDPVDRVLGSYPKNLTREPHKYEAKPAEYLTWWSKPDVAGIRYVIGADGKVASINAGGPSIRYVEGCS